jgi:hypothetical protein
MSGISVGPPQPAIAIANAHTHPGTCRFIDPPNESRAWKREQLFYIVEV